MKTGGSFRFIGVVAALAMGAAFAFSLERNEHRRLSRELQDARREVEAAEVLRRQNDRLREQILSADELERLRSDHAALPRLRAELEELRKRAAGATP